MNYKSEIADLARYFKAVHSLTNNLLDETRKLNSPHFKRVKSFMTYIAEGFSQITVPFRPKKPMNVLGIFIRELFLHPPTSAYSLVYRELKLGKLYAYHYSNYWKKLEIWKDKGYEWDIANPLISYNIGALDYVPDVINFALNYDLMKSIMKLGHFEYLEKLWKIYFDNIK